MLSIQERLALATEAIEGNSWQLLCMLRCAIPGIVKSFDNDAQTCVVQPAIQEWILLPPQSTQTSTSDVVSDDFTSSTTQQNTTPNVTQNVPTLTAIDPIEDVPIIMMRVFGWSLTFPITQGTECLLIFCDTCIDAWWQNGGVQSIVDRRRHDLSDAIALFGPWSQVNLLQNYSADTTQLRSDDGTQVLDLANDGVTLTSQSVTIESTSDDLDLEGNVVVTNNLHVSSGATGSVTAQSGQVLTFQDGICISID